MAIVIKIIGVFFILVAILLISKPDVMKRLMQFFKKGRRLYLAGLIRIALAIVFFLSARECDIGWLILVFGILFLLSGILIFTLGLARSKSILEWFETKPVLLLRLFALIIAAMGAAVIYAA